MTSYAEVMARWLEKPTTNGDIIAILWFCILVWGVYKAIDVITYLLVEWRINK